MRQVFIPMDADAILAIPLCTWIVADFRSWSKEKKGVFSVRSAYRMMVQTKFSREAGWKRPQVPQVITDYKRIGFHFVTLKFQQR